MSEWIWIGFACFANLAGFWIGWRACRRRLGRLADKLEAAHKRAEQGTSAPWGVVTDRPQAGRSAEIRVDGGLAKVATRPAGPGEEPWTISTDGVLVLPSEDR